MARGRRKMDVRRLFGNIYVERLDPYFSYVISVYIFQVVGGGGGSGAGAGGGSW